MLSNFDCDVIMKNRVYFRKYLLNLEIKKFVFFISIRGINNKIINFDKYIFITIYVNELIKRIIKIVYLIIKFYIVNNFKINIFINIDIMIFQKIFVNFQIKVYKFEKCQKLKISIDVITKFKSNSRKIIRNKAFIIIISKFIIKISIVYKSGISKNRDFLFEFDCVQNFDFVDEIFVYIVDFSILII